MDWKSAYRSFYYETALDIPDIQLDPAKTALLIIDMQNEYARRTPRAALTPEQQRDWDRWSPFFTRMQHIVIPNTRRLLHAFRRLGRDVLYARIACRRTDGRDRSLSQRRPGWNNLLMPAGSERAEIIDELRPQADEIVVCKTTDSALTGTNLRLTLSNLGIDNVVVTGVFTDQCVSSTVRSLADESFNVVVAEDCCAAGTDELHAHELRIINNIYCQVMGSGDVIGALQGAAGANQEKG
jgi:nicotinamidase-related amidase